MLQAGVPVRKETFLADHTRAMTFRPISLKNAIRCSKEVQHSGRISYRTRTALRQIDLTATQPVKGKGSPKGRQRIVNRPN